MSRRQGQPGRDELMNSPKLKSRVPTAVAAGWVLIIATVALTAMIRTAKGGDRIPPGRGLYVLDTNAGGLNAQVLLIDTSTGAVIKSYGTGFHPDMALSPDGARLYIASTRGRCGSPRSLLETYDASSGALISTVDNPDSFQTTMAIYGSTMAMAPSGRFIYFLKLHNTRGLTDEYITAFDTVHNRFLKDHASLNTECNFIMLPTKVDLTLGVACSNSASLRELTLGDEAEPAKDILSPIKTKSSEKWGAVFLQPGEQKVAFVSASGSAFEIDRVSAAVHDLGTAPQAGPWIQRGLLPENQTAVYFSSGQGFRPYPNREDTVTAVDPVTLALRGSIATSEPFFTFEISKDGSLLYTVNPEQASIAVIDANTFREVQRLQPIGHTPAFAIAAP
jgi:hypothetical protein